MSHHPEIRDGLRAIYLRSQKTLDRILASHGLSSARYTLLAFVASGDGVRSADIIKAFSVAPRTVTEAIDALEADGHVQRRPDPGDRRAKVIALTPSGAKLYRKLEPIWEEFGQRLLGALTSAERQQFAAMLSKLNGRLDQLHAEAERSLETT